MELSSHEEVEIPVPINSAFVGIHNNMHVQHGDAHMIHHHHHHSHDPSSSSTHNNNHHNKIIPSNNNNSNNGTNSTITASLPIILEEEKEDDDDDGNMYDDDDGDGMMMVKKKKIKYKECQKNHAASIGGNARDGCGEFMASGEEGSLEYLICSACNCHRNFHRKQVIQGVGGYNNNNNNNNNNNEHYYLMMQSQFYPSNNSTTTPHLLGSRGRKVILGTEGSGGAVGPPRVPFSRLVEVNMPYKLLSDRYDHHHHGNKNNVGGMMMMMHHHHNNNDDDNNKNKKGVVKKRFRTKFSQEQKEKMYEFAEKVGWKIQKQEESVVQQFCQQIGIRRRVLKVWMHNNKHNNMAKNNKNHHHNHIININNNNNNNNNSS